MNTSLQNDPEMLLTQALEHRRVTAIPADFAARVVAALPAPQTERFAAPRRWVRHWIFRMGFGRSIAAVAAIALTIALFAIAPHTMPSFASFAFDFELLLVAQLVSVAWFLTPLRKL